jgi:transmembrane sensor
MGTPESELDRVRQVTQLALDACSDPAVAIRQAREQLLEAVAAGNAPRSAWSRRRLSRLWGLALVGVAAVPLIVVIALWSSWPITFRVGPMAATGRPGDLIEAPAGAQLPVRFSEGSSFLLDGGGRARVLVTEGRGARVLVDSGDLDVAIAHSKLRTARWSFEAGPFQVQVTGTRFHMAWHSATRRFALATTEGRVVVSGTCMGKALTVAAGERVDLSCAPVPAVPAASPAEPAPGADSPEAPVGAVADSEPSEPRPAPKLAPWRERIAAGRLSDGLRAAELAGFGRVCQEASLKELVALAGAARLSGRSARASEALRALRQRFPLTTAASIAAFTLGRIALEQRGAYQEAADWFGTYLAEQPSGPLMGDAMGRLMEARRGAGDLAGARRDAERYLRRFPKGPYAAEARAVSQK